MTTERTFKVGDVISVVDAVKLNNAFVLKIWGKANQSVKKYTKLQYKLKRDFKLKIVELPEVD